MVEDSEIKTKVSPFAMRTQEIKVFDGKDGYVSMNQIIQKMNLGHLTEIHFKILELVNKFEFVTSRQLYYLLKIKNVDIASQDKLNTKLEQLVKCKILTRYYFTSVEGDGVFRIYCMEKMGKYLLTSRDIECKWQPSDNAKPVEMIKKKLAGNQVIVAFLRKSTHVNSYTLKPPITDKNTGKIFKPTLSIRFDYSNRKIDFVFDVIRRNESWKEDLKTRVAYIHNNLETDHYIKNTKEYLISWEKSRIDSPILDLIVFYQKEYMNLNFEPIIERYMRNYPLNPQEQCLFFIVISIPPIMNLEGSEISVTKEIRKKLDYLFKTENLVKKIFPQFSEDK